jgi:hypothetical protein
MSDNANFTGMGQTTASIDIQIASAGNRGLDPAECGLQGVI